jgi:diacylglycerol kinase (ATP)
MNRKFFVLANPVAGRKKVGKLLRELSDFFLSQEHSFSFEIHETTSDHKGDRTIEDKLDKSFTDLVIMGGDGTIHEAVNGLKHNIPVSIIPAGTGNDYIKCLSIGQSLEDQLHTVINGDITEVDLGECNGRKFANGMGVGFDGQIVADMQNRKTPFLSGHAKYYYHVLHILSGYRSRSYRVTVDNKFHDKKMILLTIAKGTTFGGGFKLTPHAKVDDGKLALCEIATIPGWKRYANVLSLQNGSHDRLREVSLTKATSLEIEENPLLEAHIDGEYLGRPPFKIKVLPKALKVRQVIS